MATRKLVKDTLVFDFDVERTAVDLINILTGYVSKYGDSVRVGVEYYGYDGGRNNNITYMRDETDKEFEARLLMESKIEESRKRSKQSQKEKELKELSRLMKKYDIQKTSTV